MDIDQLEQWNRQWLLELNTDKCHVMHIGHSMDTGYTLGQGYHCMKIKAVDHEKDLGVIVANDLKTERQCREAARRANWILGMIKRQFGYLDATSFNILYKAFIRPHLEYSIQAWSPYLNKDIRILENVQRRATTLVYTARKLPYLDRLGHLGLTTLERRRRGDLIEAFKIITGREDVNSSLFFKTSESIRTSTPWPSTQTFCPTKQTGDSSSFFIPSEW